jgi:uncharacterized membrane protein
MRYVEEQSSVDSARLSAEEWENQEVQKVRTGKPRRRRNVILTIVGLAVLAALYIAWQRWGHFDPAMGSQAREKAHIQIDSREHPLYFWLLIGHIMGASIALGAGVFQLWRGLRTKHPRIHRNIGRIYVFAGVLPAVFFALVVEAYLPFSVVTAVSQVTLSVLWGGVTIFGFVLRRQGRIAAHRRWMYRSYALTCSVLVELSIDPFVQMLISTQFRSRLDGNLDIYFQVKDSTENWVGLLIVILVVEGYFEYERLRRWGGRRRLPVPPSAPGASTEDVTPSPTEERANGKVGTTVSVS